MKLRDARQQRFYSAAALGKKAGVSEASILNMEVGRALPQLRTARLLAEALGVDPLTIDEFRAGLERLTGKKVDAAHAD